MQFVPKSPLEIARERLAILQGNLDKTRTSRTMVNIVIKNQLDEIMDLKRHMLALELEQQRG